MDEERRRGKEYYQVNLDMGRLFWIAFLIGVILIAVFVFGFYIGGGREEEADKLDILKLGRRDTAAVETKRDELKILDVFNDKLEAETRYIDVKSLEEAVEASEKTSDILLEDPETTASISPEKVQKSSPLTYNRKEKTVYRPIGDYYIQVSSFIEEKNAEKFADRLRKNMYRVKIEEAVVGDKTYYRVRVGPFEKHSVAVNTMTSMKRIFALKDPFVLKRDS
jgi:cell division protein FtsN